MEEKKSVILKNDSQFNNDPPVEKRNERYTSLLYSLDDVPSWHLCILFGLQHCLLSASGLMAIPLLLASKLCLGDDDIGNQARANLICSVFFVNGICTFLQCTFGNRLPIMQGSSFTYIAAALSILSLPHNACPSTLPEGFSNSTEILYNDTDGTVVDGNELWMRRVREIQGSIAVASLVEVLLGLTGAVTLLLKYIGPLTITPTIALIGLDLFQVAPFHAQSHWGIALFTTTALVLCSQYLKDFRLFCPSYNKKDKFHTKRVEVFKMFSVLIALVLGWILCWILTATDVLSPDPTDPSHMARADLRVDVLSNSPWFRIPYPFQWGLPAISAAGFAGMLGGLLSSIIESIGDYYACAKLSGAPPPPRNSINRGIFMEGIGSILSGLIGSLIGTSSYSGNIAAIGITRVASRRVLQTAGVILAVMGCLGKLGGVFVTIPEPVIGGLFLVLFGMIAAVGLSNLQYVDLNSTRNIFVIGFSLFVGLAVPNWLKAHPDAINTGIPGLDKVVAVLLTSSMLLGGMLAMFLDNTLAGTEEERGMGKWLRSQTDDSKSTKEYVKRCYQLPFSTNFRYAKYIPILPEFDKRNDEKMGSSAADGTLSFLEDHETTI